MDASSAGNLDDLRIRPAGARKTIQEVVYQRLGYALMTGQFDPGQALTISYLSDLFGTSHMPVREALRRLTAENALETTTTGSSIVPPVTRKRLDDLCSVRTLLEGAAGARAVPAIDPPMLRSLEHTIDDHAAAGVEGRIVLMLEKNQEFHFTIYRAAGSETLLQLIEALWLRFGPYLRMLSEHMETHGGNRAEYTDHHRAIVAAIRAGDAEAVSRHLVADIHATQNLLQTLCEA
jgi:DNA-binding GntR family transcriptional regulator